MTWCMNMASICIEDCTPSGQHLTNKRTNQQPVTHRHKLMILLGSTFPLSLIRRPVRIAPAPLEELRQRLQLEGFVSFWGHDNTRAAAQALLGVDPAPATMRPALTLTPENLPAMDGTIFEEIWVLSPDYAPQHRPAPGAEVPAEAILSWHVLHLDFRSQD